MRLSPRLALVYVEGQVALPGPRDFADNRTVADYIGLSGGVTNRAVRNRVNLIRPGNPQSPVTVIDLDRAMTAAGAAPVIAPGDIIFVPERRIATIGDWGSIGQIIPGIITGIRIF